jgi:hypothetical protein
MAESWDVLNRVVAARHHRIKIYQIWHSMVYRSKGIT